MLTDWLITLPTWGIIFWVLGGVILYSVGIGLSHQTGKIYFLAIAFTGVITSWSYIDMYIASLNIPNDPLTSFASILLPIALIIVMVKYGFAPSNQQNEGDKQ